MKSYILPILASLALCTPDEPSAIADWQILLRRIEALEDRVKRLEQPSQIAQAKTKPVLEVHTEDWCGPCRQFKADLSAAGDLPVEIKEAKFSTRVPAFRYVNTAGQRVVKVGYTSLKVLLDDIKK